MEHQKEVEQKRVLEWLEQMEHQEKVEQEKALEW